MQTVSIVKVMNQKFINVSIVQKITALSSAKRWLIDSHKLIFWKNLIDTFCVWNQSTPLKGVLHDIFVQNAMENTTFLFVTKEKIEIAMPRKKKVRIVLLLLSIRVKVSCYKLHKQVYLTFKLKVLLKFEFCLTQEISGALSMKKFANI